MMLRVVGWRRVLLGKGGCTRNHGTVAVAHGDKEKEGVGPGLHHFMRKAQPPSLVNPNDVQVPYLTNDITQYPKNGRIYFETYGCQMNFNDLEIVLAIMKKAGYNEIVEKPEEADVIFINTCAIRENAEHRVWHRLNYFKHVKSEWTRKFLANSLRQSGPPKVAVLGCMAERLKGKLLEANKMVDVICGPDAYRDLPRLLANVDEGQAGVNTLLSLEETYADVSPVRISKNPISAFVSIMRGCNNMCSYCIVPFTRGRERSRPLVSIVREVGELVEGGVKEVTLLGQNVNSYNDLSGSFIDKKSLSLLSLSPGFSSICKNKESGLSFTHLLDVLSNQFPEMRFRFTSPHPKDFPDDLLLLMRDRPNICNSIHLPAQSGSSRILENMRRGYTREAYLSLVDRIRTVLPDSSLSSDFITGFCGETEEDHADTLSLVEKVEYDMAYMFAYSMREKTHAHRRYEDDVPEEVKQRRLTELITTFRRTTVPRFNSQLGTKQLVLVSGVNKRDSKELIGLSDKGHRVVFPMLPLPYFDNFSQLNVGEKNSCSSSLYIDGDSISKSDSMTLPKLGDYVAVHITETTTASLRGNPLACTNLTAFMKNH